MILVSVVCGALCRNTYLEGEVQSRTVEIAKILYDTKVFSTLALVEEAKGMGMQQAVYVLKR